MGNAAKRLAGARPSTLDLNLASAAAISYKACTASKPAACGPSEETHPSECVECTRRSARVFCGGEHTLLRHPQTLQVFQLGACGLGFNHSDESSALDAKSYEKKVPLHGPAASVHAGYYHNLVRLVGGKCMAYGCGRQAPNDGQLVNGSLDEAVAPIPTQMQFADAVPGGHHTIARTRKGEVWACGAGWQGQMGNGGLKYNNPEPLKVTGIPSRVEKLGGGYYHNAALTEDRQCYVWGCNEQLQLGPEDAGQQVPTPQLLTNLLPELRKLPAVKEFDGGYGHSVLLLEGGRLFTMGNHSEGQRAIEPDLEDAPLLTEVIGLPGHVKRLSLSRCL